MSLINHETFRNGLANQERRQEGSRILSLRVRRVDLETTFSPTNQNSYGEKTLAVCERIS